MTLSVGRIVHFRARNYSVAYPEGTIVSLPAIVLRVLPDNQCDLLVHGYDEDFRVLNAKEGRGQVNTWSWPPRV